WLAPRPPREPPPPPRPQPRRRQGRPPRPRRALPASLTPRKRVDQGGGGRRLKRGLPASAAGARGVLMDCHAEVGIVAGRGRFHRLGVLFPETGPGARPP